MQPSAAPFVSHAPPARAANDARAGWTRFEPAIAALCLAQCSEPLFAAIAQSLGLTEPPGYARIFFFPVYAFLAVAVIRAPRLALRTALSTPLLSALCVLTFVSALWSIDSGGTTRRAVWLALTMALGFYLAWRYEWRALIEVIAGAFGVLIAGSFALALLYPAAGVMAAEHPGAWSGLWTHKNTLGGIMALAAPACIAASMAAPARRWVWRLAALLAFVLVLLSTSKTALIASLLGVAVIGACFLARRGPLPAIGVAAVALGGVIVLSVIAVFAPDLLASAIGRDLTLTGRTEIWDAARSAVSARPWLGYGYGAFWLADDGPAYWVRQAVNWPVASAHSGWLEMALGMGRAGVALFALQLAATLLRGARALMANGGLWGPAFLLAFTLYTLSESHVLQANDLFWAIYVAVAARLALDARSRI